MKVAYDRLSLYRYMQICSYNTIYIFTYLSVTVFVSSICMCERVCIHSYIPVTLYGSIPDSIAVITYTSLLCVYVCQYAYIYLYLYSYLYLCMSVSLYHSILNFGYIFSCIIINVYLGIISYILSIYIMIALDA